MKKLISSLKHIRLSQILTVCLVGVLVFVSTACGGGDRLEARTQTSGQARQEVPSGLQDPIGMRQGKNPRPEVPGEAETNTFQKGGMNEYRDIDPRRDASAADNKAESLVRKAERNVTEKGTDSPEQFGENYRQGAPVGERAQKATKGLGNAAKGVTEDVSEGTQQGVENLKGNTQNPGKGLFQGVQRAAEDASDFAQRKTGEAAKGVQRATEDAPGQVSGS